MSVRLYTVAAVPFEAACQVGIFPEGHRARRLHGHSYLAQVRAEWASDRTSAPGTATETLTARLQAAVAPLDYAFLNDYLPIPTDENLARWIRARLDAPGLERVGIQSTRDQGVDLDGADHAHVWRRFRFEAAHQLPNVPAGHPCGRMHGHGFEVIVHADQDLAGLDLGVDFDRLDELWRPLHAILHQACLNELPGLENPTSERLAAWLWQRLQAELPPLSWVTVYETATAGCHYDGRHYRIWKERVFESALRLRRVPADDPRRRLHGHSYRIRLHLTAPLDEVMGWTVDYGEVKALFEPAYRQLDHHRLDQLTGLEDADPASLLRWVRAALAERLPPLDRIDLEETPGCGATLCWGEEGPALPG
ncbi:MAG TPA: 6-carboxytetrahydropterin synthase [Candidatus Competibacteraceae bacterium]|nr:MAG: 6-pyruvoyl tetrahydropterin synthase [Candidatus Competibacteraceae bacterium]HOB63075.1 6-carboxytetrahydropterin synthase [Candidatus Competibacteraceae bacterium]HQD57438.1 6-carboxytetrahydropterin synthase [Candidatus Competibacteraceae bacterium]